MVFRSRVKKFKRKKCASSANPDAWYLTIDNRETVIVFDWDDTMLNSTELKRLGLGLHCEVQDPTLRASLASVSVAACAAIREAAKYGTVWIMTNAEAGWVQMSCQTFLPDLAGLLFDEMHVPVISARTMFEGEYPGDYTRWKRLGFAYLLVSHVSMSDILCTTNNILSIGDSNCERSAILEVCAGLEHTWCKSIKLKEEPTCEAIVAQLRFLEQMLRVIYEHKGHIDICVHGDDTAPEVIPHLTF
jgi:hypothetical protein